MICRQFGATGLRVPAIGFGGNRLAPRLPSEAREAEATLREGLERGITFFDTADRYGCGASERLIARVARGRRDSLVICSKAGLVFGLADRLEQYARPLAKRLIGPWRPARSAAAALHRGAARQDFTPDYLERSIDASLRRLGSDYLDVFLLHNPPPEIIEDGAALACLTRLREHGKLRHIGVSCRSAVTPEEAVRCLADTAIEVLQIPLGPGRLAVYEAVRPIVERRGVALMAREVFERGRALGGPASHGPDAAEAARRALGFVLARPAVSIAVVGMTSREHLRSNLDALAALPSAAPI